MRHAFDFRRDKAEIAIAREMVGLPAYGTSFQEARDIKRERAYRMWLTPAEISEAHELYAVQFTTQEIASYFGVHESAVYNAVFGQ